VRKLFERGRRLVAVHAGESPVITSSELPAAPMAADSCAEDDWWLCSQCRCRCPEDPCTGLPMPCQNCG
jgi:hypothetical protein